jgi:hypothetical protein
LCVWYWSLNSGPSPWATSPAVFFCLFVLFFILPSLFLWRVFQDRVLQTIGPGWLPTAILLISASWVARITGVSWQRCFLKNYQGLFLKWFLMMSKAK